MSKPFQLPSIVVGWGVDSLFFLSYVALSLWLFANFMIGSNFAIDNNRTPEVKHRPLVYMTAQALIRVTPEKVVQAVTPKLAMLRESTLGQKIMRVRFIDTHNFSDPTVARLSDKQIYATSMLLLMVYITEWLFFWMFFKLAMAMFPDSRAYALFAPIFASLVLCAFVSHFAYTYDFAELFFSSAFLYVLWKRRFGLYLCLMAIGTLNKESTLFGILLFALWFFTRLPKKHYILLLLAQIAIYAAVKSGVMLYFGHKPALIYWHNYVNTMAALTKYSYQDVVAWMFTLFLITCRWSEKPLILRYALWMLVPNMIAYLILGNPTEYRVFYWCMPPLMLLGLHTLVKLANVDNLPLFARNGVVGRAR